MKTLILLLALAFVLPALSGCVRCRCPLKNMRREQVAVVLHILQTDAPPMPGKLDYYQGDEDDENHAINRRLP